jgi:hypothetical protein
MASALDQPAMNGCCKGFGGLFNPARRYRRATSGMFQNAFGLDVSMDQTSRHVNGTAVAGTNTVSGAGHRLG